MNDYKVDVERGMLIMPNGEELFIVPKKLDISIDEFFEHSKPEWVQEMQAITELAVKALEEIAIGHWLGGKCQSQAISTLEEIKKVQEGKIITTHC